MNTAPILLVEDDDNDVLFMRNAVRKAELPNPLQVVHDGASAIEYLRGVGPYADRSSYPLPCLVLLDLNLPCRTGFEVLQWIRQESTLPTLIVLVLTSSSADADAHRAYSLGANSYLVKPSNPENLRDLALLLKLYWVSWNYPPPPLVTQ